VNSGEERSLVRERVEELLRRFPRPAAVDEKEFLGAQFDLGLAWVHFDSGHGGLGVSAGHQPEVNRRLREAGAPSSSGDYVALHQGASAIHDAGSESQRSRFLRPIFTAEEHWCQLFSEPGAGSDLAGLSTRAVRDGDEWVVEGQKVWTSGARQARWAILVARTDPDLPKHRGLTFFICDMQHPGVLIRPLRQADGSAHFNEVFLNEVRLPDSMRVGDVGQGWGISLACLNSERDGTGDAFTRPIDSLLDMWQARADRRSASALALRHDLMRIWVDAKVIEYMIERTRTAQDRGGATALGSLLKIAASEHAQRMSGVMLSLLGPAGQVGFDYEAGLAEDPARLAAMPQMAGVRSRANSIEGGTNEIQRNIIGERVLGLPGDVRVDKNVPWRNVPRN
jgi:alkylation response protein AidB-like acyl-CoA dehydrogenase